MFPERGVNIIKIKVTLMTRKTGSNPAFSLPYTGVSTSQHAWYYMKLKEEQEQKERANG